ncbi:hypothetical protein BI344_05245 [Chromobacterium sphagni]|uniref:Uncharacterized protein n=1 Tax=Chromobacterium sphagni TaxID=1903179 RepID=A0ABX3CI60_9NEIS|nr:hypothetical protein BI344_05245 [Chromobacterium sphagni]
MKAKREIWSWCVVIGLLLHILLMAVHFMFLKRRVMASLVSIWENLFTFLIFMIGVAIKMGKIDKSYAFF